MPIASLASRINTNGILVLVNDDHTSYVRVPKEIASTIDKLANRWSPEIEEALDKLQQQLDKGQAQGAKPITEKTNFIAPITRASRYHDFASYMPHVQTMATFATGKPRDEEVIRKNPLNYQGVPSFLPHDFPVPKYSRPDNGDEKVNNFLDYELETLVLTGHIKAGATEEEVKSAIIGYTLHIDWTDRNAGRNDIVLGQQNSSYGFGTGAKLMKTSAPFLRTKKELERAEALSIDGTPMGTVTASLNGGQVANLDIQDGAFQGLPALIKQAHSDKGHIEAGATFGGGTISNTDELRATERVSGYGAIVEARAAAEIANKAGAQQQVPPYLKPGDSLIATILSPTGKNLFGTVNAQIVLPEKAQTRVNQFCEGNPGGLPPKAIGVFNDPGRAGEKVRQVS